MWRPRGTCSFINIASVFLVLWTGHPTDPLGKGLRTVLKVFAKNKVGILGDGTNSHHIIACTVCPLYLWTFHLQILLIHSQVLHPRVRRANHVHCRSLFCVKDLSTRGFWCELGLLESSPCSYGGEGWLQRTRGKDWGKKRDNIWQHYKVCKDVFSLILIISFPPNSSVIPTSPGRVLSLFSDLLKFTEWRNRATS